MRSQVHDRQIAFRAPAWMLERAEATARREGMGLSEFMRAAIRDKMRDAA